MPIMVSFSARDGRRAHRRQDFGPYRVAEVVADRLWVFDGLQPFELASRAADDHWEVGGLPGLRFSHVRFLPPPDEVVEELRLLCADDDDDEEEAA